MSLNSAKCKLTPVVLTVLFYAECSAAVTHGLSQTVVLGVVTVHGLYV